MNQKQTKAAVEAMLFAAGDPVSADKLAAAVQLPQTAVETALEDLRARYAREDSGLCLLHLDTRWQLATKTEWADCVRRLLDDEALGAPRPGGDGDADGHRLQSARLPRLHRAGARRGFLVQRQQPVAEGAY